tara:strand:+ start:486 stop:677 length:192 start_codon:yes stop_codon:yes gene_type:complete
MALYESCEIADEQALHCAHRAQTLTLLSHKTMVKFPAMNFTRAILGILALPITVPEMTDGDAL